MPAPWPSRERESKAEKDMLAHKDTVFCFFVVAVTALLCPLGQRARVRIYTPPGHILTLHPSVCLYMIAHMYSGMMGVFGPLPLVVVTPATVPPLSVVVCVYCFCAMYACVSYSLRVIPHVQSLSPIPPP